MMAQAIRAEILRETGLTPRRHCADSPKSPQMKKPRRPVCAAHAGLSADAALRRFPASVNGHQKLEEMGLRTCADVQQADLAQLLKRFGKFPACCERSNGIDDRDVVVERERKSLGVERTLGEGHPSPGSSVWRLLISLCRTRSRRLSAIRMAVRARRKAEIQ